MIAALYVQTGGAYYNLPGVDPWDEARDARLYPGPHPVIAHPPCSDWCQLASVNEARWGSMIGDDGGTFAAALHAVRTYGGVLEHPAYSLAWSRYGLPVPIRNGWTTTFTDPGYTTEISQCAYGHPARKRTWLYTIGIDPVNMDWTEPAHDAVIGGGIHTGNAQGSIKLDPHTASRTTTQFRDVLIAIARQANKLQMQ